MAIELNPQRAQEFWVKHAPMLAQDFGIYLPGTRSYLPSRRMRGGMAMDALPPLVTVGNSGLPSVYTNWIDPKLIEVLTAPNKATEIANEVRKGDWTMMTATFAMIESTGEVATYGDFSETGRSNVNAQFPQRQSYLFQTTTEWGQRQAEQAGEAMIDWAAQLNVASALVITKFLTNSYFFGVAGLQNYGLLNDPGLSTPITPATKVAGGTRWVTAGGTINATPNEIYADIQALFIKLGNQMMGYVTQETSMTLVLSPQSEMALTSTNSFGVSVYDLLKKNFPNLKIVSAMQLGTTAGQLAQLYADNLEGQATAELGFTDKMRAHPIVQAISSWKQKKSAGTWGAIIYRPIAIAQILGL